MMAIIGGSGLHQTRAFEWTNEHDCHTDYGQPSAPIQQGKFKEKKLLFLPRHGRAHQIPPHKVNYRANIAALNACGASGIIAVNAVGGISAQMAPGTLLVPDQLIDYTWGREHTFYDNFTETPVHIDFTWPFSSRMRATIIDAAAQIKQPIITRGCYACTQGPRLESAAEIQKLLRDGNDVVGMTAMPEAALAAELGLDYASLCLVVNWGAGIESDALGMEEINRQLEQGMHKVIDLLIQVVQSV